jgi:hypothetical protein
VRVVAEKHRGAAWAEPERVAQGTEFRLCVPLADSSQ